MTNVADAVQAALQHHRAGRLQQAEQLYRQILQADPHQPDVLHLLGVLAYQCGQNEPAIQQIKADIAIQPGTAAYHNNLGLAHRACHELREAGASHEEALRLAPGYAAAYGNLAWVLRELGRPEEALA